MEAADALRIAAARRACRSGELSRIMRVSGLSQAEAASATGVTPATFSRWLAGEVEPHSPNALRLADLLDGVRADMRREMQVGIW
jgi:transcriptional regulator with XRE-family HTH domain